MLVIENEAVTSKSNTPVGHGLVIWTDGGAIPNPGNTGCGVHGYRFTYEPSKKGTGLSTHILTDKGYLDNSFKNKPGINIVTPIEYYDLIAHSNYGETNNAAEIDALFYALSHIPLDGITSIYVKADSEYVLGGVNDWLPTVKANNWCKSNGELIPNQKRWLRLEQIISQIKERGISFEAVWVKGHGIDLGNNTADRLASIGVSKMQHGIPEITLKKSPAEGYWKADFEKHPFFSFKLMYFNSLKEYNTPGYYYVAEPGGDPHIIGKRIPDAAYSVIKLNEPEKAIESVRDYQAVVANDTNAIITMLLDKLFSADVYPFIYDHGKAALRPPKYGNVGLSFIDKKPVTNEINPAGLTLRAIGTFSMLEDMLEQYTDNMSGKINEASIKNQLNIFDITGTFYETSTKKDNLVYTLKSDYCVGFTDMYVEVEIEHKCKVRKIKLPYKLGLDLPPRNNLKKLESYKPKVSLLVWHISEESIQYATVIETSDGIGIWTNYFANRMVLLD